MKFKKSVFLIMLLICTLLAGSISVYAGETKTETQTTAEEQTKETPSFQRKQIPSWKYAKSTADGITLKWKKVTGAAGYIIYRQKGSGDWKEYVTVTSTKYVDEKVSTGKKYSYRVRAFGANGKKGKYDKKGKTVVFVGLVNNLTSEYTQENEIQISWDKLKGASGYRILRRAEGEAFKKLKDVTKSVTSYVDDSAASGVRYEYAVKAYKKRDGKKYVGRYDESSIVFGRRITAPNLKSAEVLKNGIRLKWSKVSGATGYKIYRKEADGELKLIKKTKKNKFRDTKVKEDVKNTYQIIAYQRADEKVYYSLESNTLEATFAEEKSLAAERLEAVGGTLKKAYNWAVSIPYSAQPVGNAEEYATWSFKNEAGDCLGKAAVFCMMARELGYKTKLMYGYVPRRGGGTVDHGWVEIKDGDNWYICDPDFEYETGNNGYFINYGQSGTWMYQDYSEMS